MNFEVGQIVRSNPSRDGSFLTFIIEGFHLNFLEVREINSEGAKAQESEFIRPELVELCQYLGMKNVEIKIGDIITTPNLQGRWRILNFYLTDLICKDGEIAAELEQLNTGQRIGFLASMCQKV